MADHKATVALDALVAVLTHLKTTGSRVARRRNYPKGATPAISVRLADLDPLSPQSAAMQDSWLEVETLFHVEGSDDTLDGDILQIDAEAWAAIMVDTTLGGPAIDIDPLRLTIEGDASKETPSATGIRRWRIKIRHAYTDPRL